MDLIEPAPRVVHLRFIAGKISPAGWLALARAAQDFADATVYLPGHGVAELRGVEDVEALRDFLAPELETSPRVVLASPLSRRARSLARACSQMLSGSATLGIDAGDGHVLAQRPQLGALLKDDAAQIVVSGQLTEKIVPDSQLPQALADAEPHLAAQQLGPLTISARPQDQPIGWLPTEDGKVDLGAQIEGSALPAAYAQMIGRMDVASSLTPWGGIVFHELAEEDADVVLRFLAPRGFIFDVNSPLLSS